MKEASSTRCRQQAALHRSMAEEAQDAEVKAKLLQIAKAYEEIAAHIDRVKHPRSE